MTGINDDEESSRQQSSKHPIADLSEGLRVAAKQPRPRADDPSWSPRCGCDVIARCGHKVGEIVEVESGYIVVEVGFFHPSDLYVPIGAIDDHDDDDVFLTLTKGEVLHAGWDVEPIQP
ncbi:MAG TPA: hypothetical protein VFQ54_10185 [Thermomicrobiales bacterium]|nr:hypothetical protein [Thermomicrobiales bacterium]